MKLQRNEWYLLGGVVFLALITGMAYSYLYYTKKLLTQFEGFRAHPYWDVKRYSWGYGTAAPGAQGTITKEKALLDLATYVTGDYLYLKRFITVALSPVQWAALLSFSYNLGKGSAAKLASNINKRDLTALQNQWESYAYADGHFDLDLEARRKKEFKVFFENHI